MILGRGFLIYGKVISDPVCGTKASNFGMVTVPPSLAETLFERGFYSHPRSCVNAPFSLNLKVMHTYDIDGATGAGLIFPT